MTPPCPNPTLWGCPHSRILECLLCKLTATLAEKIAGFGSLAQEIFGAPRRRAGEGADDPAASRITGEPQQTIDKLDPSHGRSCSRPRHARPLARTLYVGPLNDCFFDPATAACLNGNTERSAPATAQCRPDRCPNSCITTVIGRPGSGRQGSEDVVTREAAAATEGRSAGSVLRPDLWGFAAREIEEGRSS